MTSRIEFILINVADYKIIIFSIKHSTRWMKLNSYSSNFSKQQLHSTQKASSSQFQQASAQDLKNGRIRNPELADTSNSNSQHKKSNPKWKYKDFKVKRKTEVTTIAVILNHWPISFILFLDLHHISTRAGLSLRKQVLFRPRSWRTSAEDACSSELQNCKMQNVPWTGLLPIWKKMPICAQGKHWKRVYKASVELQPVFGHLKR